MVMLLKWQRLIDNKGETCPRCEGTEEELERVYTILNEVFKPLGIDVKLIKETLSPEEFRKDPLSSNRIWINDKTLEEWLEAETGSSQCCDVCGDSKCRTIKIGKQTFETIPANLIIKAALKAAAESLPAVPVKSNVMVKILNRGKLNLEKKS